MSLVEPHWVTGPVPNSLSKEEMSAEAQPPIKKMKIIESDNLLTINCDKFLDIIADEESKVANEWADIKHLVLKCDDKFDYKHVYLKYVDVIANKLPNLKTIRSPVNFLFQWIGKGWDYSSLQRKEVQKNPSLLKAVFQNLEEVHFTDCMEADFIKIGSVQSSIKNYPSLKSIHAHHFILSDGSECFAKDNGDLNHIKLNSHLPTVRTYFFNDKARKDVKHMTFDAMEKEFGLRFTHKPWTNFEDPRSTVDRDVDDHGNKRWEPLYTGDFTQVWVGMSDCSKHHSSVAEQERCEWCGMFREKTFAIDPQKCIMVNGIRYKYPVREYKWDVYNLQFPADVDDEYTFDGCFFWIGMPDDPEQDFDFESTELYLQNPAAFELNTDYYLTYDQLNLLRPSASVTYPGVEAFKSLMKQVYDN